MSSLIGRGSGSPVGANTGLKSGSSLKGLSPEQTQLFQQMLGQTGQGSYLSKLAGGDEDTFNQLEAPAMQQFGQLQAGIANRFSGAGLGGRHSSGFQNAQTSAASDFASQLQSQRMSLQRNAINDLQRNSAELLGMLPGKPPSIWESILGIGAPIAGAALGSFGGPAGMAMGAQAGSALASGFNGNSQQMNFSGMSKLPTKWGAS